MYSGIFYALSACFIWGLIFVVPELMNGFTPLEIALGRYFVYGILSSVIFLKSKYTRKHPYDSKIWIHALFLSFLSTIGYYSFVVLGLRMATSAICALILGICPITIAFYGNWKQQEVPFKSLILPSALIFAGLLFINFPHLESTSSPGTYTLGLICAFIAMFSWSWYVVENARFLKKHPHLRSNEWTTLIGVATLFWSVGLFLLLALFFPEHLSFEKYLHYDLELKRFLIGSLILGLLCSWVGAALWNKASVRLPVSLTGQLMLFETIFGLLFVYLLEGRIPPLSETTGMALMLASTFYALQQFSRKKRPVANMRLVK
jgi:drug/metabolite transporter (DMT)-like permease